MEIPYRSTRLVVDADAADWSDSGARFTIARAPAPDEPAARAEVRLAWDRGALWAHFDVTDPTYHPPPVGVGGAELFQWDSVEIYLDGLGDRAPRMGADDFQILLAPDGRHAVLQGDPLLLELEALTVPKRERPELALECAGRRRADGYLVECAIPLAALGIAPRVGGALALDLGLNDWLADHALAEQLHFDLEALRKLDHRSAAPPREYTENGLEIGAAQELEARFYRPWSLAGTADFGHPERWAAVTLAGGPAFADRFVEALGAGWTLAGGALSAILLAALLLALDERRNRRRIADLLGRLAALEAAHPMELASAGAPGLAEAPGTHGGVDATVPAGGPRGAPPGAEEAPRTQAPAAPDPLEWLEHAVERPSAAPASERLELKAVRAIHARLGEAISPAELAAAVHVSLRTLQRHLTESLGCSPGELLLAVKMREARRLLEAGELQVQQVARRVGYDDPAHFSRRFKAYFGLSPAVAAEGERSRGARSSVA